MTPHITPNLIVGLGVAMPVFAESFPSNGLMLANKTYSNAATGENMGAYEGTVTATAVYENKLYQIAAGQYLPAGATMTKQCPANSYCPGATDVTYNESAAQGATSCPSGYPNSDAGAWSDTQCYTACTLKSANIEHATAVSGNDYYGDGTDTCVATACENGYHAEDSSGVVIEQTPLIDVDYTVGGNDYGHISADGGKTYQTDKYGLTENNTGAAEFDYGVVYSRASCQDTSLRAVVEDYSNANFEAIQAGTMSLDQVRSDLTPIAGAARANYTADFIARTLDGTASDEEYFEFQTVPWLLEDASFSTTDTGQYCYCQMTGFLSEPSDENGDYDISRAVAIESAPWVFNFDYGSADVCASNCAKYCAVGLRSKNTDDRVFRGAVYGALDFVAGGTCEANEITINWSDAAEEDIAANNAGMCTYGGDIRTPIRAATKPGKTFVGWKFSK